MDKIRIFSANKRRIRSELPEASLNSSPTVLYKGPVIISIVLIILIAGVSWWFFRPSFYWKKGFNCEQENNTWKAIRYYKKAIFFNPNYEKAYFFLEKGYDRRREFVYSGGLALDYHVNKKYDLAEKYYKIAYRLYSKKGNEQVLVAIRQNLAILPKSTKSQ
ncbi:MAG: hypothetical protein PHV17_10350 [Candidatus Omnitrophica bacterium]|nr:hypothetical protein [Candidatus Omnitrophota bacterium]